MVICPHCRAQNVEGTMFCGFCGKELTTHDPNPKCPRCGSERPDFGVYCGRCGAELPPVRIAVAPVIEAPTAVPEHVAVPAAVSVPSAEKAPEAPLAQAHVEPVKSSGPATTSCRWCGAPMSIYDDVCMECDGRIYSHAPMGSANRDARGGLVIAGVLMVVVGVLAFGSGFLYLAASGIVHDFYGIDLGCCGVLELLFGMGSLVGGAFAIDRKHFLLVLIGAIVGILTVGPLFLGSILSLIAVVLVAMGHQDFRDD